MATKFVRICVNVQDKVSASPFKASYFFSGCIECALHSLLPNFHRIQCGFENVNVRCSCCPFLWSFNLHRHRLLHFIFHAGKPVQPSHLICGPKVRFWIKNVSILAASIACRRRNDILDRAAEGSDGDLSGSPWLEIDF